MMNAYDKEYLLTAMENLGEALDYAFYCQNLSPDQFMTLFINSRTAVFFQEANPKYINMSGTELVLEVLLKSGKKFATDKVHSDYDRSSEYWTGWILAYYQWKSGKSFEYIQKFLPASEINRMYNPLHEAPEQKFAETADKIISELDLQSNLQKLRKLSGLSQKELAEKSGVSLRMIQQYEIKAKDISKASGTCLISLSKTLNCSVAELIEGQ